MPPGYDSVCRFVRKNPPAPMAGSLWQQRCDEVSYNLYHRTSVNSRLRRSCGIASLRISSRSCRIWNRTACRSMLALKLCAWLPLASFTSGSKRLSISTYPKVILGQNWEESKQRIYWVRRLIRLIAGILCRVKNDSMHGRPANDGNEPQLIDRRHFLNA